MDPTTRGLFATSAGGVAPVYVEDVFQTWLYTGNGSTQTITNGIDLSGKGGLVWTKLRATGGTGNYTGHLLFDTIRGSTKNLKSDSTAAEGTYSSGYGLNSFNADGFTVKDISDLGYGTNETNATYASWTFRKQAKFFDVVTYTGNGTAGRQITHGLGSAPGFIITKRTDGATNWLCYHRSLGFGNATDSDTNYIVLNSTSGSNGFGSAGVIVAADSSTFTPGASANVNGGTYVAYLFAHDAGGFGASGNDSIVKCGTYTGNASSPVTVNLGWEPQWILIKSTSFSGTYTGWAVFDNMRGIYLGSNDPIAYVNQIWAENTGSGGVNIADNYVDLTSTGFVVRPGSDVAGSGGQTYAYVAIRRGPMKTPTNATTVFNASTFSGQGSITTNFPVDASIQAAVTSTNDRYSISKLAADTRYLVPNTTAAEFDVGSRLLYFDRNTSLYNAFWNINVVYWNFRRAPGFFDVVAYTGTGANLSVSHNLNATPELIISKSRSSTGIGSAWFVYTAALGSSQYLQLSSANAAGGFSWGSITSTTFQAPSSISSVNYIAYLFASCPGVSKVGSYTGTGTIKQIDCGFTAGARFVMIKRTDSTGDWYIWDSARGISSGNDPYLILNSTLGQTTGTDYIDPYSPGFEISSTAPADINANGGSFIYLAIA